MVCGWEKKKKNVHLWKPFKRFLNMSSYRKMLNDPLPPPSPPQKITFIIKIIATITEIQSEHSCNRSLDRSIIGRWMCKFTIAIITFSSAKLCEKWLLSECQIDEPWDEWSVRLSGHQIIVMTPLEDIRSSYIVKPV